MLSLYDRKNINTPDPWCANSSHPEKVPASLMETESVLSLNGTTEGILTPRIRGVQILLTLKRYPHGLWRARQVRH